MAAEAQGFHSTGKDKLILSFEMSETDSDFEQLAVREAIFKIVVGDLIENCVVMHPVKLSLIFRDFYLKSTEDQCMECEELLEELGLGAGSSAVAEGAGDGDGIQKELDRIRERLVRFLGSLSWDTTVFGPEVTVLHGYSDSTGNCDVRGGGCGYCGFVAEDFRWTATNPGGIRLRDLCEVVYRLKGSKYDSYYEMYGGFAVESHKGNEATIAVSFDYGS
ncbi:MAG: hypothetical protein ACYCOU_10105 [Sulfobacillus sp.]